MMRPALITWMLVGAALTSSAAEPTQANPARALDFLEGTWTSVKDGLSGTVRYRPVLSGSGWQSQSIVDDGNDVVATTVYTFDARAGQWTSTWFNRAGARSTYVGGPDEKGRIALVQVAYNGRAIDPPQSRIVIERRGPDRFTLDWQSRGEGDTWIPREKPFVHRRVERPDPPAGEGRIAFISKRDDNWEIYTMRPDGSDARNLTTHPAGDHVPRWIAGGSRVAFRSQRSNEEGGWERWEVVLDGSDAERVPMPARLNNPDVGTFPEVHPGGSYLVNAAGREGEQDSYVWRYDGGGERVLAPAAGLDYRPLFSPDGTRVLFISERDGNPEVYIVGFDGRGLTRLTESPGIDRYARWSPDGTRIACVSDRDGNLELYVMNADGSGKRRLTRNEAEDGEPSWSPDSRKIAFRSDVDGNGEIYVVDVESGALRNLTRHPAYDGEPVWSPGP